MITVGAPRPLVEPRQVVQPPQSPPIWRLALAWAWMVPLIYLALHGGIPILTTGGGSGDFVTATADSGGFDGRIIMIAYALVCCALLLPYLRSLSTFIWHNKLQMLLPALAVLSTAWSQYPSTTINRSILGLVLLTCLAYCFVGRFTPEQQMQMITLLALIIAVSSLAFFFLLPKYGVDPVSPGCLEGIFRQKNSAARTMIFLLPAILCLRPKDLLGRMIVGSALFSSLAMIALTRSRTGWLLALLCVVNLRILRVFGKFRRRDATIVAGASLIVLTGIVAVLAADWKEILIALGKDATLTGRVPLWSAVLDSIAKRPLLGWGYNAFWFGLKGESLNVILKAHWSVPYAHNGFLDVWLSLGLVGLAVLIILILKAWKDAYSCFLPTRHSAVDWYISILMLTIFYNLDEGTFLASYEISWFLFVVAALGLGIHARELRAQRQRVRQARSAMEFAVAS